MYKKLISINLIIVCLLFLSSYAMAVSVKKQALLVGISDYKGKKNDLPGIQHDIKQMKTLFERWGFEVKILYGKNSLNVRQTLKAYANNLSDNDVFIYYHNGHGSFVKDENGDEGDGRDEVFILSDGRKDTRFVDDELNYYLSNIKARKLILLDSCHSGTASKGGGGGKNASMEKSMLLPPQENHYAKKTKVHGGILKGREYIVLAAAGDEQKAIATDEGSLFSRELYSLLTNAKNQQKSLIDITKMLERNMVTYCKKNKKNEHQPQLSASSDSLKKISIKAYLMLKN